jgi:hypothetical protein
MPLLGTRDMTPLRAAVPLVTDLHGEPLVVPSADVLIATFEIDDARLLDLLPKAVHPTIPPMATFVVWQCHDGPFGPFSLAQVRVSCRAGFRSRGYLLGCFCDSEKASAALAAQWGFNAQPGSITLDRYFDAAIATVDAGGEQVLRVSLVDPVILSSAELEISANFNLARVKGAEGENLRLVQVEPEYGIERPDRGKPRLDTFVASAWSAEGLEPNFPVSSVFFRGEVRLPRVRYLIDPDVPLQEGTETVAAPESE